MTLDELHDQVKDLRAEVAVIRDREEVLRKVVNDLHRRVVELERHKPPVPDRVEQIIEDLMRKRSK